MTARWNPRLFVLPPFSPKAFAYALLLFFLPNLLFLAVAAYVSAARPLVNLDYIVPALLLLLPWKPAHLTAAPVYWLCVAGDMLMLVMQWFPFMDLDGVVYLAPFILSAPLPYRLPVAAVLLYMLLLPPMLKRWPGPKTDFYHGISAALLLLPAAYFTGHMQYHDRHVQDTLFGRNNFYYARSQLELYIENGNIDFIKNNLTDPALMPLETPRAAANIPFGETDKILFVIVESWGDAQHRPLHDDTIQALRTLHRQGRLQNWQEGTFPFDGATVEAELRELCALKAGGFALRHADENRFTPCLPIQLQQSGYTTASLHGASGALYDRLYWYPKAGFRQQYFAESPELLPLEKCSTFGGVCDDALFPFVSEQFKNHGKLFFYWLTLTSHSPYPERDIRQPARLDCERNRLPQDTMLCSNYRLHAQFFDKLAQLLAEPHMAGTRVLLVSDHAPPTTNLGEGMKYLNRNHIPWISFTVSDGTARTDRNTP